MQLSTNPYQMLETRTLSSRVYGALTTAINSNNSIVSADHLDAILQRTLDQHLPLQTRTISQMPVSPWFPLAIKEAKQQRRRAERRWRKSRLTTHRQIYKTHSIQVDIVIKNCISAQI
ncbi:hypothetical protein ElyMa_001582900 [Elysia marginata]|uniref:Uncharacterized protein n=1 Tax=Elysia marginata TaxID=1093978 RepID=A0AAV4JK56_9GAST|nr:hypothetical protein ElyMa_001582900 [Elysia marginata]